jgi:hypothetical protein
MKILADMVGDTTLMRSTVLDEEHPVTVKLLAVESGNGIWVECQKITDHWMAEFKISAAPRTLVWFVPFSRSAWIMGSEDYPSISEKGIGL